MISLKKQDMHARDSNPWKNPQKMLGQLILFCLKSSHSLKENLHDITMHSLTFGIPSTFLYIKFRSLTFTKISRTIPGQYSLLKTKPDELTKKVCDQCWYLAVGIPIWAGESTRAAASSSSHYYLVLCIHNIHEAAQIWSHSPKCQVYYAVPSMHLFF